MTKLEVNSKIATILGFEQIMQKTFEKDVEVYREVKWKVPEKYQQAMKKRSMIQGVIDFEKIFDSFMEAAQAGRFDIPIMKN